MACNSLARSVVSLCLLAGLSACGNDDADTATSGGAPTSTDAPADLPVQVQIDNTPETNRRFATVDALEAVWDADQGVVYYATDYNYSTGCPPAGTARSTEGGDIALTLAREGSACRSDIRRAVVVIENVQVQPNSLTITENGKTQTFDVTPLTGSTRSGKPFKMYTHCGVESAMIQGRWWHADPPLYNKRGSSPPAGWGDPFQMGTLVVESSQRAVFQALGQEVVFVPAPDNEPVRMCD